MKDNNTIKLMQNRKSVRSFSGESISKEDIDIIVKSAQQASTSINGQQISLVVTENKDNIKKIGEISGGQMQIATSDKFITVIIDFNRTNIANNINGKEQVIHKTLEGIVTGCIDAGIMVEALQIAATALDIGTTIIGGIRKDPKEMIELLGLPPKTFPIVGIALGVIDKNKESKVKPRVEMESFSFYEKYDNSKVEEGVKRYDKKLRDWYDDQGLTGLSSYIDSVSLYSKPFYKEVKSILINQEFDIQ